MNVTRKLWQLSRPLQRSLHTSRSVNGYEGPGKTVVSFIKKEIDGRKLLVTSFDENGFAFNTGTKMIGPIALFPQYALSWRIKSGKSISAETLSLFSVLEPKPDVLIIGLDDRYDFAYHRNLREIVNKLDITHTEIVSVRHACTIFNFINEEGRYVVAALIPPVQVRPTSFKMLPKDAPKKQIPGYSNKSTNKSKVKKDSVK